ncbi:MAG TPA: Hpt domain-containing protein, partial [Rubrivivax sp.]|nr:Hpt domain-containing protein [Rubrivivax sp.]
MNMQHDMPDEADAVDDLSTLAWVHDELRRSLESAHKSLRRYLKEADARSGSDVSAVDPSVLRSARAQLHQGVGALEMIGLPGPARLLRASENAVQRFIAKPRPLNRAAVEAIESASFGVLDYLGRKLAGKGLPTLALFPQYRALQELAGADRVHPADLWRDDWQWHELRADAGAAPRTADLAARNAMETQVLAIMRANDRGAMARLSELCAGLGASSSGHLAGLWQLSAAFYEAQAAGLLQPDVYAKRVSSRLLAQLRLSIAGHHEVSQRLAQDVLFFCAHARAPDDPRAAPRLQAVREAYEVDSGAAFDYLAVRLGRFDPAWISQARKRVAGAKEVWSAVAGGEAHRMIGLAEQFALVGDSLKRLYPSGEVLADALQAAASQTLASGQTPPAALAMEVATSVIYLDASLEDAEFDHPLVASRVQRLAQRIHRVCEGREAQALEPWMEELYRRVSDRQTMGSVVQELHASLSEVEKQIDQYFRNPAQREALIPVPSQLSAMRGVLSVLDMEQASQAVLRMRDDVDALLATDVDPQRAAESDTVSRLADNLGALSFMIDMLSVQPQMAKSLFRFDPDSGNLTAVMGRRTSRTTAFGGFDELRPDAPPPLVHQAQSLALAATLPDVPDEALHQGLQRLSQQALLADQRALAETMVSAQAALLRATDDVQRQAARTDLAQAVAELAEPQREPSVQQPMRATPAPQPEVHGSTGLEDDAEMREIFIDEAREVLQGAHEALQRLHASPDDLGDLTLIRRAFHTLKGSSRMVGLKDYGDAAWACEQLYNARLAETSRLEGDIEAFTLEAVRELGEWVEAIAAGRLDGHDAAALCARAEALRRRDPSSAPATPQPALVQAPGLAGATLLERVPQLPSAADLQFDFDLALDTPTGGEVSAEPPQAHSPLELDLDLADALPHSPSNEALLERVTLDLGPLIEEGVEALNPDPAFEDHAPGEAGTAAAAEPGDPRVAPVADEAQRIEAGPHPQAVVHAQTEPWAGFADTRFTQSAPGVLDAQGSAPSGSVTEPGALDWQPEPAMRSEELREAEQVKIIGDLRIGIPLFNIYLNEADELSRRLCTELSEWA